MDLKNKRIEFLAQTIQNPFEVKTKILFFAIDFNIAYSTEIDTVPIEVGIVPFTLFDGPMRSQFFHEIINEIIPSSYQLRAKQRATFEHGISAENNPAIHTSYEILYDRMSAFIMETYKSKIQGKSNGTPILIASNFSQTLQCIRYIAKQAGKLNEVMGSVFSKMISYEDFVQYYYISKGISIPIDVIPQSVYKLLNDDVNEEYYCDFHKEKRPRHFCCAKVNATYFADVMFRYFNVLNEENNFHKMWDK